MITAVVVLENDPLFNAGYGSSLTADGEVEMDASLMVALPDVSKSSRNGVRSMQLRAGGVAMVRRLRNPILAARAVMERTPHVLMVGRAAERLAVQAGMRLCRSQDLIASRARKRWQTYAENHRHGTVGAVAVDCQGSLAAATSTGGIVGKMSGRVGDSAIIGAGTYADSSGAASATGEGEAIMKVSLCRQLVARLSDLSPARAASRSIAELARMTKGQAGVIVVDREGRIGYAHNAQAMEIAFIAQGGCLRHLTLSD